MRTAAVRIAQHAQGFKVKTYFGYKQYQGCLFSGMATPRECVVCVREGEEVWALNPRTDIYNHSPTGFNWGYSGSGPAQLALALVTDACGEQFGRSGIYQAVKLRLVSGLPDDGWVVTQRQVRKCVMEVIKEMEADLFASMFPAGIDWETWDFAQD